jgi:hypothetical protein
MARPTGRTFRDGDALLSGNRERRLREGVTAGCTREVEL